MCGSFLFKVLWPEKQQTLSFWVERHLENCQPRQPFLHLPCFRWGVASWQVSAETWAWVGCKGPTVRFPMQTWYLLHNGLCPCSLLSPLLFGCPRRTDLPSIHSIVCEKVASSAGSGAGLMVAWLPKATDRYLCLASARAVGSRAVSLTPDVKKEQPRAPVNAGQ